MFILSSIRKARIQYLQYPLSSRNGRVNGSVAEDENTPVDSNSDKINKSSNGDIVNGDIDDEGGGGAGDNQDIVGKEEQVAAMES